MFFSSHILSDAEALCDRVCLLVDGRLRMEAPLEDLLGERVEYWEVACEGLDAGALSGYQRHAVQGGLSFYRLADEPEVDRWVDAVRQAGGRVYRVAPQRMTLEDYFVAAVQAEGEADAPETTASDTP